MINTSRERFVWLSSLQNIKRQDIWDLLAQDAAADQVRTERGMDYKRKGKGVQG